jgi:hypothetical protein
MIKTFCHGSISRIKKIREDVLERDGPGRNRGNVCLVKQLGVLFGRPEYPQHVVQGTVTLDRCTYHHPARGDLLTSRHSHLWLLEAPTSLQYLHQLWFLFPSHD